MLTSLRFSKEMFRQKFWNDLLENVCTTKQCTENYDRLVLKCMQLDDKVTFETNFRGFVAMGFTFLTEPINILRNVLELVNFWLIQ